MSKKIPLIKEYRIYKLVKCLECFNKFAYNREKQRDCILSLYPNKMQKSLEHREKSIFRGMVIPSLRYLGLIIGFEDMIKLSANGKLIVESQFDNELHERCRRAVVYETDTRIFNFLTIIEQHKYSKNELIMSLSDQIIGASDKQKKERIEKWLSILHQVELIENLGGISINKKNHQQVLSDINPDLKDFNKFCDYTIDGYYNLSKNSAGVVDIRELRQFVAVSFMKESNEILTENQFDYLFRKFMSTTKNFHISLGEPMGPDQKLFEYKDNFYKTVIMREKEVLK